MILVFGKTGQVACALQRTDGITALDRQAADLTDPAACAAAIRAHRPQAVINAAAFTGVDAAARNLQFAVLFNEQQHPVRSDQDAIGSGAIPIGLAGQPGFSDSAHRWILPWPRAPVNRHLRAAGFVTM